MLTKDDICFHPVVEEEKKRLQESTIAWGTLATKTISPIIYHGPQSSERKQVVKEVPESSKFTPEQLKNRVEPFVIHQSTQ